MGGKGSWWKTRKGSEGVWEVRRRSGRPWESAEEAGKAREVTVHYRQLKAAKRDGGVRGLKEDSRHERRGWGVGWCKEMTPSISHFKRGGEWGGLEGDRPPPSRFSSEGGGWVGWWKKTVPSVIFE